MGNQEGGFHESDSDDNELHNKNEEKIQNAHNQKKKKNGIYMSQYAMNLYGVTDSGEFVANALKRIPKENQYRKIREVFKYKKKLGEGASGKVLLAQEKNTKSKRLVALKELRKKHRVNAQLFLREVVILESLKHPNILELMGVYLDRSSYFIATAYYSGGEFFDRIIKIKKFSEKQALKYIIPILEAIKFMHEQAIVHRDIKPSNMVFDKKGSRGVIKIIDFGTSEIVIDEDLYPPERVGTILYAPPEWKKERTGRDMKKGDLWALGVIVYVLMVGRLPFGEWKHIESYNNDLWFPKKKKQKLSYECVDFILSLLQRHCNKRLDSNGALKHKWVDSNAKSAKDDDLGADLVNAIQSVHQENKITRIIGKAKEQNMNLDDIDEDDKEIILNNVKNQKDVEKYLDFYHKTMGGPDDIDKTIGRTATGGNKDDDNEDYMQYLSVDFDQNSKQIMQSIHKFKEQQIQIMKDIELKNNNENDGDEDADNSVSYDEDNIAQIKNDYDTLNQEEFDNELKSMLGDAFDDLKGDFYENKKMDDMERQYSDQKMQKNSHKRQLTHHKNPNNPLNIQNEKDEEMEFDASIVTGLMELGLATKNACVRAVLATQSLGVNQAAEWLMDHQNEHGINQPVDVV